MSASDHGNCMQLLRVFRQRPARAKDQGYAWVILVLSFLSHFLHIGFFYSVVGIVTVEHQEHFNISRAKSGVISSVNMAVFLVISPITSVLVKKIGCRWSMILGTVLVVPAMAVSYLSTKQWHAMVLFGVLLPIGMSLNYLSSTEVLGLYFNKYKNLVYSTVAMGYYVGMTAWPVVSQYIFDLFGYSKAMILLSLPQLFQLMAGALFYEPSQTSDSEMSETVSTCLGSAEKESLVSCETEKAKCEGSAGENQSMNVKELTAITEGNEKAQEETNKLTVKQQFITLLSNVKVWSLLISSSFLNGNSISYYILVNDFIVRHNQLTEEEAALGVTITGIGNLVGCATAMVISRIEFDRVLLHFIAVMTFALSTVATAFSSGKVMFYLLAAIWGYGIGLYNGNLVSMVTTFCLIDEAMLLLGLLLCFGGVAALLASSFIVMISEKTNNQIGMVVCGCLGLACCVVILPVIISNCKRKRKDNSKQTHKQLTLLSEGEM